MKEATILGFKVEYEEKAKGGINYLLYDLDPPESRVFFDQARDKKQAHGQDI